LFNFEPPTTDEEVRAAAIQFVRKVSGQQKPSRANREAFDRAVDDVSHITRALVDTLITEALPRSRELEALKAKARAATRFGPARTVE